MTLSRTSPDDRLLGATPGGRSLLGVLLAAATLLATLMQVRHGGVFGNSGDHDDLTPAAYALLAGTTLPLAAWWRWPLAVFVVTGTSAVLLVGLGSPVDMALGPAAALFLLAADRNAVQPWTWRTSAVTAGLFAAFLVAAGTAEREFPGIELLHTGLAWTGAWFAGERTRLRRDQVAELRERAAHAERDAARERQLAVAEERTRIARDLHDSAGHAISVIAVRAGAARLRDEPDRSRAALAAIEELARRTVAEVDQIVGGLREEGPDQPTPHGLASLETLVAQHAAAGLIVESESGGTSRPMRAAADQAAYRILQESLTNAARYGTGTARVRLAFDGAGVELTVTNPVAARTPGRANDVGHAGHGLVGMQERAALLGGHLEAGRLDGLFRVRAWIPDRVGDP
jgi:signal transduction histidine kinase